MNPLREIGLIVARELRKNLRSAKGLVLLLLSLLGGTGIALLIVRYFQNKFAEVPPEALRAAQEKLFTEAYEDDAAMGHYLGGAPLALVVMLMLSIWLAPLLVALAGFDGISGEVQNRTVRFWTVRVRRSSYFVGKFLGIWAAVSIITLVMNMFMWGVSIGRGAYGFGDTLSWGIRFWLVSLPLCAIWCGIATFVASLFRTPILGLLTTFVSFFVLWFFGWAIAQKPEVAWLGYLYPNHYDSWLMSPHFERVGAGLGICVLFAALPVVAGTMLFRMRDV